jgi:hypothetical protein
VALRIRRSPQGGSSGSRVHEGDPRMIRRRIRRKKSLECEDEGSSRLIPSQPRAQHCAYRARPDTIRRTVELGVTITGAAIVEKFTHINER